MTSKPFRRAALALLALSLAGCSVVEASSQPRGNRVDPVVLKELVPGTSTRADVSSLIGSPTAKAVFDENTWYYISETTTPRIGRVPGVTNQQVVELDFDPRGTLRTIHTVDQDQSKPVSIVSRTTPSPGSEASFMQQLLGNVGKFGTNPLGGGAGSGSGGSGATFGGTR